LRSKDIIRYGARMLSLFLFMNGWKPEITDQNYWHDALDHVMESLIPLSINNII